MCITEGRDGFAEQHYIEGEFRIQLGQGLQIFWRECLGHDIEAIDDAARATGEPRVVTFGERRIARRRACKREALDLSPAGRRPILIEPERRRNGQRSAFAVSRYGYSSVFPDDAIQELQQRLAWALRLLDLTDDSVEYMSLNGVFDWLQDAEMFG